MRVVNIQAIVIVHQLVYQYKPIFLFIGISYVLTMYQFIKQKLCQTIQNILLNTWDNIALLFLIDNILKE